MLNSLVLETAKWDVGPDRSPNCLQKLSADNAQRVRAKAILIDLQTSFLKNGKRLVKMIPDTCRYLQKLSSQL